MLPKQEIPCNGLAPKIYSEDYNNIQDLMLEFYSLNVKISSKNLVSSAFEVLDNDFEICRKLREEKILKPS